LDCSDPMALSDDMTTEGYFSGLPAELRKEIFSNIDDYKVLVSSMAVNRRWKQDMQEALYFWCKKRGYLEDEEFWKSHDKDWKWIFKARVVSAILKFTFSFLTRIT